ncbi:ankyrin repeat domain-containing protein 16-like isoform X2 [Acanthaster planci]|uniref:Ankyrin repeat domain-containing protein 16-like isoform X2 n=1 Tax=Acanthaster planci TaxID=133434 RepID=A0A8B7Z472_ACAPL|nr:ankyrin repeat domain-containing protein 16-like isoform X2 [Acanthaster planci]
MPIASLKRMQKQGETFVSCAQKGDVHSMQILSAGKFQADEIIEYSRPRSGDRAVHLAARHDHVRVLEFLKVEGTDFETANLDGKRALHEAAVSGNGSCVAFLLSTGVQVDPLKRADWEGHVDILTYLLDCIPDLWDTVSKNGRTPLHTAALHGKHRAVSLLLTRGSYPVDQADSCGSTPLMDALRDGFVDIAQLLVDQQKAEVHKCDILGRMAVHLAAQAGCQSSVTFLVSQQQVGVDTPTTKGGSTPLHLAAKECHFTMLETLHSLGANINAVDDKGRTALHIAAAIQNRACVETLLRLGALDCPDKSGRTPSQLVQKQDILKLFDM